MSRLLLLRHGQSTWNAERRWQGWADPPLSAVGREQAAHAAAELRDVGFDAVVSSDLARARETASIIGAVFGLGEVEVEVGLRERDVGEWSGLTTEDIEARWPGQLDAWRAGQLDAIPGGEGDITSRVVAAMERVLVSHPGGTVLAVTHGGVIRTIERHLDVLPQAVRNVGGRWVTRADDGGLVAGEVVQLRDPDAPAAATTVL